ncbi:hypothetical protein BD408DRAFT_414534 [Parasitella parasitica]|nr:hypothetical protein BD408DRAFT_414534 [Parasitella parasitica]
MNYLENCVFVDEPGFDINNEASWMVICLGYRSYYNHSQHQSIFTTCSFRCIFSQICCINGA